MLAHAHLLKRTPALLPYLVFAVGLLLLLATGFALYSWISLGTEALLVPWQCECTWDTRPALGTAPRALNDFFAGSGRDLPSLIFVLVTGAIVAIRTWQSKQRSGIYSDAVFLMDANGNNVRRLSLRNDEEVLWYRWLPSKDKSEKP